MHTHHIVDHIQHTHITEYNYTSASHSHFIKTLTYYLLQLLSTLKKPRFLGEMSHTFDHNQSSSNITLILHILTTYVLANNRYIGQIE